MCNIIVYDSKLKSEFIIPSGLQIKKENHFLAWHDKQPRLGTNNHPISTSKSSIDISKIWNQTDTQTHVLS